MGVFGTGALAGSFVGTTGGVVGTGAWVGIFTGGVVGMTGANVGTQTGVGTGATVKVMVLLSPETLPPVRLIVAVSVCVPILSLGQAL
jgi:hypothetical protein